MTPTLLSRATIQNLHLHTADEVYPYTGIHFQLLMELCQKVQDRARLLDRAVHLRRSPDELYAIYQDLERAIFHVGGFLRWNFHEAERRQC